MYTFRNGGNQSELRQRIIAVYENWWDKYRVTAREIEGERDMVKAKLDGFLRELGYAATK